MILVDRCIQGLFAFEGQSDQGFGRRRHDATHSESDRRRHHVVSGHHVGSERLGVSEDVRGRNRREVNHRIVTAQRFGGLTDVGEVCNPCGFVGVRRCRRVDVGDLEPV